MENSNNKFDKKKFKKSEKEKTQQEVDKTVEEQSETHLNEEKDLNNNNSANQTELSKDPNSDKYFSDKKFSDMNLSEHTFNSLTESGFETATEIQAKCIPMAIEGMDIIGSAKTGSGKSLAFLIPAVEILARSEDKESKATRVLVLTPTRELALQLFNLSRDLLRFHEQHTCALIMGGANRKVEAEKLRRGVSLIIATPGRLLDHLVNTKGFDYSKISLLVIDEADDILKIGFEKELKEIMSLIPNNRQTMLFSATLSPKVEDIITLSMKNYQYVGIKSKEATVSTLEQGYVVVDPDKKFRFLYSFIRKNLNKKIMVFFSTIKAVEFYSALLNYVDIPCKAIHGDQKQQKRSTTYLEFCGLEKGILLCTDVAQRGLDFPDVDWVIQYDPPHDPHEYLHRVGRTARGANKRGKALLVLIPCEIGMVRYLKSFKVNNLIIIIYYLLDQYKRIRF
jgi:ATP-dependent RNA helicase DDX18/HAS1